MKRYWLNPASMLIWAMRLSLEHPSRVITHRRPAPKQYALPL